ncbi:DNA ligase [Thalassotalea sediminis]|uniref:DNA ligase n=1 Tax=Thalassotalea sediminis TaxID=1759089 RepID=UPI0025742907|nr:DNA ligase [Thalassotalea sediminis]
MGIKYLISILFIYTCSLKGHELTNNLQHGIEYRKPEDIKDYWVSEKLDGIRGRWTGTTLLTRNGNRINAPKWFTQQWPKVSLDGEIWLARNEFQTTLSCIMKQGKQHHQCWRQLAFMLFDLPDHNGTFSERIVALKALVNKTQSPHLKVIQQVKISTLPALENRLTNIIAQGGEGLMLHHKDAYYQKGRSNSLMKLKRKQDAEAKVINHILGKGKFAGMLGALEVQTPKGIIFRIGTGFTNAQRKQPPNVGSTITYQYIGKTKRGVPRFASFLRIRSL